MSKNAGAGADKQIKLGMEQLKLQKEYQDYLMEMGNKQMDFAKEEWGLYKDKILPLEMQANKLGIDAQELALARGKTDYQIYQDYYVPAQKQALEKAQEGIKPQYAAVTREALGQVNNQFDQLARERMLAQSRRGIRPDSGAADAAARQENINRAATSSYAVNQAVQNEQNRADQIGFNQLMTALGRTPGAYAPSTGGSSSLGPLSPNQVYGGPMRAGEAALQSSANAAGTHLDLAGMYGNQAAAAGRAGAYWGGQLGQAIGNYYDQSNNQDGYRSTPFYHGGEVKGYANGGNVYPDTTGGYAAPMAPQPVAQMPNFNTPMQMRTTVGAGPASPYNPLQHDTMQAFPGYANGGQVNGPPGRDQVPANINGQQPARLTAGEYVIPEDVVRRKGSEFFDKLVEKYHERAPDVPLNFAAAGGRNA